MAVFTGLGSNAAPSFTFSSDTNTGMYSPGADQLALSTNGVQRINIEADGDINIDSGGVFYDATNNRLSIGTTAPTNALQVVSGSNYVASFNTSTIPASSSAISIGGYLNDGAGGGGAAIRVYHNHGATIASSMAFEVNGATEAARIDGSGYLRLSSYSGGIQFNGDTAAANALDDYEEGTWTPVLAVDGTNSTSTVVLNGHYRKIGSMIWLDILVQQANTVPLDWSVGWSSITGSPFSRRFALIGAHGLGNLSARFPLLQVYWTGGQSQQDGSIKIRASANTGGADNYYQTVFSFVSVNY